MIKKFLILILAVVILGALFMNCNNVAPDAITVLQVHLEDSLSVQAGIYDSIRIDLTDKDGKVYKERVFAGPYDKVKDKAKLEDIEVPGDAPAPLRIVISAYKGKVKQAEFDLQVSSDKTVKVEVTAFVPPVIKDSIPKKDTVVVPVDTTKVKDTTTIKKDTVVVPPIDTTKKIDTTKVPTPGHVILSPKEISLFEGGDSTVVTVKVQPSDSGKSVIFKSRDEEVFIVASGSHLLSKKAGQAILIAFIAGFPATADTAKITVLKDIPVIDVGMDRRVPLDSVVSFPAHITQKFGTVKSLKWDLDGDGQYDDSASKSDTILAHTYKVKGEFPAKFYVRDSKGNEVTKTIKVQAGILTPFVVITKPNADTLVNSTPFLLEYTVDGAKKSKSVTLLEGKNIVPINESNTYGVGTDTATITLDTHAPGMPVFTSQNAVFSRIRRPTWNWSQNPTDKGNGSFKIVLDGGKDTIHTSALFFTPILDLTDGPHFMDLQERDDAGNWSLAVRFQIKVDVIAPNPPVVSSDMVTLVNTSRPTWNWISGGNDGMGLYRVKVDNNDLSTGTIQVLKGTFKSPDSLKEGSHLLYVQESDSAGNWSGVTPLAVRIDVTPPGKSIFSLTLKSPVNALQPTWTWASGGNGIGLYRCKVDNSDLTQGADTIQVGTYKSLPSLSQASHTLYVQERDSVGNWSVTASKAIVVSLREVIGNAGFSLGPISDLTMARSKSGVLYVGYSDVDDAGKIVVKKFNGSAWEYTPVSEGGFSKGAVGHPSLAISSAGIPYVAFSDRANGGRITVMKYNGAKWDSVGHTGFSDGDAPYPTLAIGKNDIPFVAFQDNFTDSASNFTSTSRVMQFNGTAWVNVGSPGVFAGAGNFPVIAMSASGVPYVVYCDENDHDMITVKTFSGGIWITAGIGRFGSGGNPTIAINGEIPYVSFPDKSKAGKLTVMAQSGSDWKPVGGNTGVSDGEFTYSSIAIGSDGFPYVAFNDASVGLKATVLHYNGTAWEKVGIPGFSAGEVNSIALAVDPLGIPYIGFSDNSLGSAATVMKTSFEP